jgi:hypothetical protein
LICSDIDALPSFSGTSTIFSSSGFVVEGMFRKFGVVHSSKMVNPVLFVFGSHVLYSRDLQVFSLEYFLGGKRGRCVWLTTCHIHVPIVQKSGSLNLLEPCGPVQACNGTALPFTQVFSYDFTSYFL